MTRILHVVTNVGSFEDPHRPTGLWLSELTHAWDAFEAHGFEQRIASPAGGFCPLEPRALKFPLVDDSARRWYSDRAQMALLGDTDSVGDLDPDDFDAVYLTGGHAVMYDFTGNPDLEEFIRAAWETGKVVSAVCHGYCGLLNVRLTGGARLVEGRRLTGFSWAEEVLAGAARQVPFNAQERALERGADYVTAALPFSEHVVVDGRLVTGQNPASARATAQAVARLLEH